MSSQHSILDQQLSRHFSIVLVILVAVLFAGISFTGIAAAQSTDIASDTEVSPDGSVELVFTPTSESNQLSVSGDVAGWTVEEMSPNNALTSPSDLPTESANGDNWATVGAYTGGEWRVTVSPPDNATVGESYAFSIDEQDGQANQVASDSFTVDIIEASSGDDNEDSTNGSSSNNGTIISDAEVGPNGSTELVFTPNDNANQLSVSGEIAGWTVEKMSPNSAFTSPSDLPTKTSSGDNWGTVGAYNDGEWRVTVSPPDAASAGDSYSLQAEELDGQNNQVAVESFTINISESTPVPDWVEQRNISADQYRAFDTDESSSLNGNEIRTGVSTYINNLPSGEVNGVEFGGADIRELVNGYINNELG